jgi:DNA modification methylase
MDMVKSSIIHGDCLEVLKSTESCSVELVIADPPFNISLKGYDGYLDNLTPAKYIDWTKKWLSECHRVLKDNGSIYVLISDEFMAEIAVAMKELFTLRNYVIWNYGFGQATTKKFSRCKTFILYFVKNGKNFTWNGDDIKVPSARQLKYGDKRAKAGGKMPEDVWDMELGDKSINKHDIGCPCRSGGNYALCHCSEVYRLIDEWHRDGPEVSLHFYLGMTEDEYARWLEHASDARSTEWEEEYERRKESLDNMPGGAQGACPDMRDFVVADHLSRGDRGGRDLGQALSVVKPVQKGHLNAKNQVFEVFEDEEDIAPQSPPQSHQSVGDHFPSTSTDVWKISRVAGTFKERIKDPDGSAHPCQLPEALLERIIKVSSSSGDTVLDPFCGTGTTAATAHRLNRGFITIDRSEKYCQVAAKRIYGDPMRFEEYVAPKDDQLEMF